MYWILGYIVTLILFLYVWKKHHDRIADEDLDDDKWLVAHKDTASHSDS